MNQAIRYLQYCIKRLNNTDEAIHNYLLTLYAQQGDQESLLKFLHEYHEIIDKKYALRLCTKHNQHQACVHIYSYMKEYEEAVDLALKIKDIELAKINADKPDEEEERKKLWLRIARHVVEEERDIKKAMDFLSSSDLLKIEDILPFFPEFVLIDDFKEQICSSLEGYNIEINNLKKEMDEATSSADHIRQDIKRLRNKYGLVNIGDKCDLCGTPVLSQNFYLFPCRHIFHSTCLIDRMMESMTVTQCNRVRQLQIEIATENSKKPSTPGQPSNKGNLELKIDPKDPKVELDEHVASECIFCGDVMIREVDKPFVSTDDVERKTWEI